MAAFIRSPKPLILSRLFSTTTKCLDTPTQRYLEHRHKTVPPYPFPVQYWYKKANFGLYGGLRVRFGNTVSEKNEIKTRRRWYPNVHRRRLWSDSLGRFVRIKVTTRVLRTIDKVGGLDEYLLGGKTSRIRDLGMSGWALRWRVMRTPKIRERMRREREALGLDGEPPWESDSWQDGVVKPVMDAILRENAERRTQEEKEAVLLLIENDVDDLLEKDDEAAQRGEDGGVELEDLGGGSNTAFLEDENAKLEAREQSPPVQKSLPKKLPWLR